MSQIIGHGSQFELQVGSTYTPILGVMSIDLGSDKVDAHDNTDMGTAGITRTFVGGLHNPGDVSVKLNVILTDTSQAALFTAEDGTLHNFKAIYPGALRTVTFSGLITSIDEQIPDDKLPTLTCKIQVSGPKVYS